MSSAIDPNHGGEQQQPANGAQGPHAGNLPMDYPVMNPEFSQQMLSGAVFPSAPPGSRANARSRRATLSTAACASSRGSPGTSPGTHRDIPPAAARSRRSTART